LGIIRETYDDIIGSVDYFTEYARRLLQNYRRYGGDYYLKNNYGTITTSVVQWKANRFYYLKLEYTSEYERGYKLLCPNSTR